ncbi:hypothetical protein H480_19363 [Amycolatopsis vancoresmycina DSM 44592]|uniref:Uncharacterized protein n=1 Tax=Amycolatopsis vancoresmycina DSM 44592 TaxID=1292037 RepID=R1I933_9PSEU|nr:hypothetical protein H480_19363 [Amycolatopsis vancoresmycina DSM 44592]
MDVGDLASLLPGIASIITALGGVYLGHRALKTGSRRERRAAAQRVIDRAIGADDEAQDDDDRRDARAELLRQLRELEDEEDS